MKLLINLSFLFILLFSISCVVQKKETFDLNQLRINDLRINDLDTQRLIVEFGNPQEVIINTNEFTGEITSIYSFEGITFNPTDKEMEISSPKVKVSYKRKSISVGDDIINLRTEYPNYFRNVDNKNCQIDIPISNTTASYIHFLIKNGIINTIFINENY